MVDWEKELSSAKGEDRVGLIIKLSEEMAQEDLARAESLAIEGIELAQSIGDELSMHRIGANLASIYFSLNDTDKGIEWASKSLRYFEKDKRFSFDKAKVQLTLAMINITKREYVKGERLITDSESYFKNSDYPLWNSKISRTRGFLMIYKKEYKIALDYYEEALKLNEPIGDVENMAIIKTNIGLINSLQNHYPEALEILFELLTKDCSKLVKSRVHSVIGGVYRKLEDWEPAEQHLKQAIELKRALGMECSISYGLFDLGVIYKRQLNFGEGLKFLNQSLAIQKKCKISTGNTLTSIGNIHNALGEVEKANKFYEERMELAESENDWEGIWGVYYNKGFYAHKAKRYKESRDLLLKSLQIAVEKKHLNSLMKSNMMLTNAYDGLGMEDSSAYYAEKYYFFKDSISGLQKIKKIGALEQMHSAGMQKDSIASASQIITTPNQGKRFFEKINVQIVVGGSMLLAILAFLFYKIKRIEKSNVPESKQLDREELDHYFQELFERLNSNQSASFKSSEDFESKDMTEFLSKNLKAPKDWEYFEYYFEKVHKDFFKNLKARFPKISTNELNLCALLKLNIRNKDMAKIMGISPDSVRKAQHRLSKKVGIPEDQSLRDFIVKF